MYLSSFCIPVVHARLWIPNVGFPLDTVISYAHSLNLPKHVEL